MKTLYLEKRGCDFFAGDEITKLSNVGNYRVCTPSECIKGKDGRFYFLEFTSGEHRRVRYNHKVTGKPLKHPVIETVLRRGLFCASQYTTRDAYGREISYRNPVLERSVFDRHLPYTLESILEVVNEISADTYDKIEFI